MHPTAPLVRGAAFAAALVLVASSLPAAPVISEIHFHPPHAATSPEPVNEEWIEIHNPDAVPVDVGGWAFSSGVDYIIGAPRVIPAGGWLVVAANMAAFQAANPGFGGTVIGGWTGQLSNSGEKITLRDALGNEVDTVDYADEGDWAIRGRGPVVAGWAGHQGWDWFTNTDALGRTKELVRTTLRKNSGQNWADSAANGGTPGAQNSVNAANVAPVILGGQHRPQIPRSTDAIVVSAKITDDNAATVTATLRWRLDGAGTFASLPMTDADADGEWTATIPAQANLSIIEWYISATDGSLTRTWPAAARTSAPGVLPETFAQSCNALLQVDNSYDASVPWTAGAQPVYRLVMTAAERAELRTIQESDDSQNAQIDAAMNATFIATDGTGQDTRYRCAVRNRGFSSRSGPPSHFSLALVSGEEWAGRASFQMNCRFPHAAVLSAAIFQLGGMPVQEAAPVQLRVNGLNPAISGQGVGNFTQSITNGALARTESLGGDWASNHFPNDDGGNFYRVDDHDTGASGASNRFQYPGSSNPASYQDIYRKQTNVDQNDYSDLAALFQALNDSGSSAAVFMANLRARADIEQWAGYIALDSLVGNMEGGITTGRTDDFSMYRGLVDQRFRLVPHDFDTTLGQNTPNGLTRSIFSHVPGITGMVRMFNEPEFLHIYYRRTVELCNSVFNNTRLDPLLDEVLSGWPVNPPIAAMKTWIGQRRTNVLNQIPQVNSFSAAGVTTSNGTLIDGMKQTPDGAATFTGQFNVAAVQSVYLNGQAATLQWRTGAGTWTFAATAGNNFLKRGPNRVNVVYFSGMNGTGSVVFSASVDVYNAAGTVTTVNADGTTGTVLPGNLVMTAPASYIPGIPFLVGVEYRTSDNVTDKTQWTKTVPLTANNGVTLTSASTGGGAANVTLYNGRGSLLVNAVGGAGGSDVVLLNGRNTAGSITPAGATPATWSYYTGAADPVANWFNAATTLTGWSSGVPIFYRNETGLTGTAITTTSVGWALRTTFNVTNPGQYTSAKIRVQRDDGVKIYFNGVFLTANGLLETDAWNTVSTNAIAAAQEPVWQEYTLPVGSIIDGANTIAIEVHNNAASNDQRLNCEITAVPAVAGPSDPGSFTLSGTVDGLNATKAMTSLGISPAMTNKSGTLAGSETWSGVINVTGDVTVPAGATLTISPGTHVLMAGTPFGGGAGEGADLIIIGPLNATGTQAQPISITCSNPANRWGELNFPTSLSRTLSYCLVSRACHSPAGGHSGTGPMIRLSGTELTVEDSILADSPGKIILNEVHAANLTVRRSVLARSVMGTDTADTTVTFDHSLISDMLPGNREAGAGDEDAMYIDNRELRPVYLTQSVFANCGDDALDILGRDVASVNVFDCILRNSLDKGINVHGCDMQVLRSQIVDCDIGFSVRSSDSLGGPATTQRVTNCTIVCENHPANTGDGAFHSIGIHTRSLNGDLTTNTNWIVKNTIISAEEPVANDYPTVGSTVFGGMNFTYSCFHDLLAPANAVPTGTGNISADPLYTGFAAKNFKITTASPCRDTGDPALTDGDGSRIDMGALPFSGSGSTPTNIIWSLAGSPYRLTQNTTIAAASTLTVEPGVNVYFDQNVRLRVNGRMIAAGTANARIRFSHVPGTNLATDVDPIKNGTQTGAPKWGGIRVYDSLAAENIFRFCDFVNAQGTSPTTDENFGSLGFIRSWGWADNLTFAGSHLRMCYGRNCKITVTHCNFPDMFIFDPLVNRVEIPTTDFLSAADNRMEPLKVEHPTTDTELAGQTGAAGTFPNGLPRNGHWRCYYNDFHGNRGHQDVFDADSGRWSATDEGTGFQTNGQFMLDCRYNTFHGISGDEHIDLGGDAFIANNTFYTGSKDQWTIDTGYSNAISSGDKGTGTTIVVARNVFHDLDHAINLKINTATIFEHNTCSDFHQDWNYDHTAQQDVRCAAVNLYVPNDGNAAGDGAYVAYNIFYGNSVAPDDTVNPDPIGGFPRIFSWPDVTTTGAKTSVLRLENNFVDDRILDTNIGSNHAGGLFAPAWGFGNVQGNPLFVNKPARDFSLAPDSPAKGKAAGGLDYGATIGEWVYLLNVPPAQTPSTSANITVGGPGIVAYKWRLDGGAWSARIQIGDGGVLSRTGPIVRQSTIALSGLTNGAHTLEVIGQDMAGNWQDNDPAKTIEGLPQTAPSTAVWTVNTALQLVRINEVAASTADGNDWVELYNAGAASLDVSNWILGGDALGISASRIPANTVIPPGGYAVVTTATANLRMDKDGDALFLLDPASVGYDSIIFGTQPLGLTLGRTGTAGTWTLCSPTSGSANAAAPFSTATNTLRITEVHAASVISYKDDWIEICNTGALPVALTGLVLTDNRAGNPGSVIPPHSYIGANACAVFLADGTAPPAGNHLSFALDSQQENVALLTGAGTVLDEVMLFPQTDDFSQTRLASGGTAFAELATRGFTMLTTDPAYVNALNIYRSLRITEIMYNAQGGSNFDWLELRNTGATTLNLNGVSFDQGISFTFGNVTLAPGQNIVLVKDVASFQGRYGAAVNIAGPYSGQLDNGGETLAIRLAAPFDQNVLCFDYDDAWYLNTDGLGRSLALVSTATERDDYGDISSWSESAENGGSPDGVTIATPTTYTQWLTFYATTDGLDADNDGLASLAEYGLSLNPQSASSPNGASAAPTAGISTDNRLQLSFNLLANPGLTGAMGVAEVTYTVQVSTSLTAPDWTTLATKTPSTNWTGSVLTGPAANGFIPVTVRDTVPLPAGQRRFIRLLLTWTP